MAADRALAESRHRFISTARLRLAVGNLLLAAPRALELGTDTLLRHWHLRLLHVFLLVKLVRLALLCRQQLRIAQRDKLVRRDIARHDTAAQLRVGLVLEVLEQRADLLGIFFVLLVASEQAVGGVFDRNSLGENGILVLGRTVGEAVIQELDAIVPGIRLGSVRIDLVRLGATLLGIALVGPGGTTRGTRGSRRRRRRHRGGCGRGLGGGAGGGGTGLG